MKSSKLVALVVALGMFILAAAFVKVAGAFTPVYHDLDAPHEEAALDFLHRAEQHLQQCKINAGGYCAQALTTIRTSIKQVETALMASDGQMPPKPAKNVHQKGSTAKKSQQ